ncbi:MAG: HEAT repeat domain-containing protein [Pirellulaceae bacterium]
MIKRRNVMSLVALAVAAIASAVQPIFAADDAQAAADKETQLIAVLESDAPPADKAITCKQLAVHGTKNAVPALAKLLPNAELASWSRIALEAIPDPAADAALREAMGQVQGRLLVGVLNSIGVRRDLQAVDGLAQRLTDADPEVASAAAIALGQIGDAAAAKILEQALATAPAAVRSSVAEGCIYSAEQFLAGDNAAEAVRLYDLVRAAEVPQQRIMEATRGAIVARRADGIPLLVEQLKSDDKSCFAIGLSTARELSGSDVTAALLAEMPNLAPERQALVMVALSDRGDASALPAVLQAAKSGPVAVRIAALRVLPRLGDVSCVPTLLDVAAEDDAELVLAAKESLQGLSGDDIDAELTARLDRADTPAREALIAVVGDRRIGAAVPALLKAAEDSDAKIRSAALTALGSTVEAGDLSILVVRVVKPLQPEDADAAKKALLTACVRMPDREACAEHLVNAMAHAPLAAKCTFAEILGAMGGPRALGALAEAAKTGSPELKDTASQRLGAWMTVDAGPVLLDVARNVTEDKYKIRALRGYIRIARQFAVGDQRVEMCRPALELCQRPDEKKLVLEVLQQNPSAQGLALAASLLKDAAVKSEASQVAVAIAEKVVQADPAAVADAMKQVIAAGGNLDAVSKAKTLAEQAKR